MKRKLTLFPCLIALLSFGAMKAQNYEHLTVTTGYTADVIANGAGNANVSTSLAVDNANYNFMSNDFLPPLAATSPAYALPANGLINSAVTTGLSFQLAPLTGSNSLRIPTQNGTGTLAFSNNVTATKLIVLATSGSGPSTISAVVNFTDDTSQTFTGVVVPDWFFSSAQPVAVSGFGRVLRTTNAIENPLGDPRLYQITLDILPANQVKMVESVQFTKTSLAEGVLNVFAVTADVLSTCPSPTGLAATSTATGATVTWNAPVIVPAVGYEYYYSDTNTAPGDDAETSGDMDADTLSAVLSGLDTGVTYYFWVRSVCSDDEKGPWQMTTFTTGQLDTTYTSGDISTLYFNTLSSTLTVNSTTTCPGMMSVSVPAGYQIASVGTSYTMTGMNNAYQSEQRTLLVCTTTGLKEAAITSGPSVSEGGTASYNRTGLSIADGATGTVNFELRAWRVWGDVLESGCGVQYNKVDNNSWKITIVYELIPGDCETPETPSADAQTFCGVTMVSALEAEGVDDAAFNWYTEAEGGTPLAGNTMVSTGSYFVTQTVGTCESEREEVAITVNIVDLPSADPQLFCGEATVEDLMVSGSDDATFNWYATGDSEEPLSGDTELNTGVYYVSQTVGDCESARLAVDISVNIIDAPEPEDDIFFCSGATVADVTENGEGVVVNFYTDETEGEPLAGSTVLESSTYYISISVDGCESERVAVDVTINVTPLPETDAIQEFCGSATVADLTAEGIEGADLNWYETPTSPLLGNDAELENGSYFVSQTVNGCESERVEMHVVINPAPAAPVGDETQEFNEGETVSSLDVDFIEGAMIQWFILDEDVWMNVSPDDALVDGGVYYVTQTIDECTSDYLVITANQALATGHFNMSSLSVYPNPASDVLTVANGGVLSEVVVTNLLGQEVIRQAANAASVQVNVSRLPQGSYILQVRAADGGSASVKIVKQ
jgi:hypothetical protein